MICSTSICAVIPLRRHKTPFCPYRMESPDRPAHHALFQFRHVAGRLGAMAGTQYRGATAENRRLPQRSRTLWQPMLSKHRISKKLAAIRRILELPNRRSRIFPKTKPRRSIPQTRHRSARYPLHHTRQTVVVRLQRDSFYRSLLAILLRRLAESIISDRDFRSLQLSLNNPSSKTKGRLKSFQTAFKP